MSILTFNTKQKKLLEEYTDKDWLKISELLCNEVEKIKRDNPLLKELFQQIEKDKQVYLSIPNHIRTETFNKLAYEYNRDIEEYFYLLDIV